MTCHQNQRPFSCLKTVVFAKPTLFRGYRFRLKLGVLGAILENGKEFDLISNFILQFFKTSSQGQDNCVLLLVGKNPCKFIKIQRGRIHSEPRFQGFFATSEGSASHFCYFFQDGHVTCKKWDVSTDSLPSHRSRIISSLFGKKIRNARNWGY